MLDSIVDSSVSRAIEHDRVQIAVKVAANGDIPQGRTEKKSQR